MYMIVAVRYGILSTTAVVDGVTYYLSATKGYSHCPLSTDQILPSSYLDCTQFTDNIINWAKTTDAQ